MIDFLGSIWRKSDHCSNPFLSQKSSSCFNDFYLKIEANLIIVSFLFYLRDLTVVLNLFLSWNWIKSDHTFHPFLSEKSNRCFNDFYLEFLGNLTIFAILFHLRNLTFVSMIFYLEIIANLTIAPFLFYLDKSNRPFSMIFYLETEANLSIVASFLIWEVERCLIIFYLKVEANLTIFAIFLTEKSNRCFNDFLPWN